MPGPFPIMQIAGNYTTFKELAAGIQSMATATALIVGGGWACWKFLIQGESHAKIEFGVDLRFLGIYDDKCLVEAMTTIENKGVVRHRIRDFSFDILCLPVGEKLIEGDVKINKQVFFKKLGETRRWIPEEWKGTFIDAGVKQNYTHVTHLPTNTAYVELYARFKYPGWTYDFHSAQKIFAVPTATTLSTPVGADSTPTSMP